MISVILPIYNVEQWLPRCIESIFKQTYSDWELILVNDGSEDGSWQICQHYEGLDTRVKAVTKQNGGVGSARNAGLRLATGDWVAFIDPDDYVEPEYLSLLHEGIVEASGDLACIGHVHHYLGEITNQVLRSCVSDKLTLGDGFNSQEWRIFNFVWGKLFRLDIIRGNNLCFDERLKLSEDYLFALKYITFVNKAVFIPFAKYHYVRREDSLSFAKRELQGTKIVHRTQTKIFNEGIKGRFSKDFEKVIGEYIVEIIELLIKLLYKEGERGELAALISRDDIKLYAQYKKCCSIREWILKQVLSHGFVTLYAQLALLAEKKETLLKRIQHKKIRAK